MLFYCLKSQDTLSCQELDVMNAANAVLTIQQQIVDKFNNPEYIPVSSKLPNLHITFAKEILFKKPNCDMAAAKAKDFFLKPKPRLQHIINNHE